MVKRFIILLVLLLYKSLSSFSQTDTAYAYRGKEPVLINYPDSQTRALLKLNLDNFIGKEIYMFLLNDTVRNYYNEISFLDYYKYNSLNGIYVDRTLQDSTTIGIEIFVKKFKFPQGRRPLRAWDLRELLKENCTGFNIIWFKGANGRLLLKEWGNTDYLDKE